MLVSQRYAAGRLAIEVTCPYLYARPELFVCRPCYPSAVCYCLPVCQSYRLRGLNCNPVSLIGLLSCLPDKLGWVPASFTAYMPLCLFSCRITGSPKLNVCKLVYVTAWLRDCLPALIVNDEAARLLACLPLFFSCISHNGFLQNCFENQSTKIYLSSASLTVTSVHHSRSGDRSKFTAFLILKQCI